MAWKSTGRPTDRQLGTHTSQRAARRAVADLLERGDVESAVRAEKGTVAEFINSWRPARSTCRPRAASNTSGRPATSGKASAGSLSTS